MITYEQFIREGVYDPNIFKAVFMAGGPGSGKSFIAGKTTGGLGLKVINSDAPFERFLKKEGLSLKMPDSETLERDIERERAKKVTASKKFHAVKGRLGIIIDGTGHIYDKVAKQAVMLQQLGYETSMVFVNTSLEVALARNEKRERTVQTSIATKSWKDVQKNIGGFQALFGGSNFVIVDNSNFLKASEAMKKFGKIVKKYIDKFVNRPIKNARGKNWVRHQMTLRGKK